MPYLKQFLTATMGAHFIFLYFLTLRFTDFGYYAKIDTAQVDIMIPTLETTGSVSV